MAFQWQQFAAPWVEMGNKYAGHYAAHHQNQCRGGGGRCGGRAAAWQEFANFGRNFGFPAMDVTEDDTAYVIELELPGVDPADISVTLGPDNVLTIAAGAGNERAGNERADGDRRHGQGHGRGERRRERFTSFKRSLALPRGVDAARVSAALANGVLEVTLPKAPAAAPRAIPVRAAAAGPDNGSAPATAVPVAREGAEGGAAAAPAPSPEAPAPEPASQ